MPSSNNFLNDQEDDDRDLWDAVDSAINNARDRQRVRGFDREPLDNAIEGPFPGTAAVDLVGVLAEQSQLKEDVKRTTISNSALYAVVRAMSRKIKLQDEQIKALIKRVTKESN